MVFKVIDWISSKQTLSLIEAIAIQGRFPKLYVQKEMVVKLCLKWWRFFDILLIFFLSFFVYVYLFTYY